jgi:hypothetical protein
MKLPSIQQVVQAAERTFLRFPSVLVDAGLGTVVSLIFINYEGPAKATVLFKILFATILGIPLLLALALTAERKKWQRPLSLTIQAAGVLLLIAYGCTIPADLTVAPAFHIIRLIILAIAFHLLVAVAPFIGAGQENGFWNYNKTLAFRLLTALLYSHILYVGFCVALVALDQLFGIDVPGKRYGELYVFIMGLFNTWFFLAGIPEDLETLEQIHDYPKGIKICSQYILSPLVAVYLVILYAYIVKILLAWSWPQGWVSKLILGFSGTGLFALLLLYPVRENEGNGWIRTAWRWFFVILIPLMIVLPLAVWRRISQYGITEGRFSALALGAWLVVMILYFLLWKKPTIKIIPCSLFILAVLISCGPWGLFAVSEQSQIGRLKTVLLRNNILVNGRVQKAPAKLSTDDSKQISSIIAYLHDLHGYSGIQSWFQDTLKQPTAGALLECKSPADVTAIMGVEYMESWMRPVGKIVFLNASENGAIDIAGYDHMLYSQPVDSLKPKKEFPEHGISYRYDHRQNSMTFMVHQGGQVIDSLKIELQPIVDKIYSEYSDTNPNNIPKESMCVSAGDEVLRVKIYLRHLRLERKNAELKPAFYWADILYSIRQNQNDVQRHK